MYPILLGSIVGVAILIDKFIQYRRILRELEIPLGDILKNRAKPKILVPILEGLKNNCDEKEVSIIGTKQIRRIEKGLSWLALIASIEPLLGLTGTVTGMIKAFIGNRKEHQRKSIHACRGHLGSINHYSGRITGGHPYPYWTSLS